MVATWKIEYVNNLYKELSNAKTFAIANAMDIPSSSLHKIRKVLKSKNINIKVVRKKLLIKALERLSKENPIYQNIINQLKENKRITVTLLIPKESINPFILNKILEENKTYRAARPDEIAPEDIVIPAGPTPFTPGPVLSELKKFGLNVKVEGGKIVIAEEKLVTKKGDKISKDLASLLQKLNIEPIPVKLSILLAFDKGVIYTSDILSVPLEKYLEEIKGAFRKAIALSVEIAYPNKYSMKILLRKGYENAIKVSMKTGLPTKDSIKLLLAKAINTAIALSQYLPEDIRPVKIETKTVESNIKIEEKKEEKKEESSLEGLSALFGF